LGREYQLLPYGLRDAGVRRYRVSFSITSFVIVVTSPAWPNHQTLTVRARWPAGIGTLPHKGIACGTGQETGAAGTIGVPLVPAG
jgi:hypothetical protein